MPGAGDQGAGNTPAGGYYESVPAPGVSVFPDPNTALPDTGRYIDQRSRGFVLDTNGNPVGMNTTQQLVQIAWSTLDLTVIGNLDDNYQARARALYTTAVQPLINQNAVVILSFQFARFNSGGVRINIRWKDLTTNTEFGFAVHQ